MKKTFRLLGLLAAACSLPAQAQIAKCGAPAPTLVVERYTSADCEACWRATPPGDGAKIKGQPFVLDWIVPSSHGDEAPLAPAALAEASQRLARSGALSPDETLTTRMPLPSHSALSLQVEQGPGWYGYMALRMKTSFASNRPLPSGLAAYLALVEAVPAGEEGSPVPRRVVRTLVGPMSLQGLAAGHPVEQLQATRLPQNGKPERLVAVGWVETAAGHVLAVGESCLAPEN